MGRHTQCKIHNTSWPAEFGTKDMCADCMRVELGRLRDLLRRSLDLDFDNAGAVLDSFKDEVRAAIDKARGE